jgi:hypothetical protein
MFTICHFLPPRKKLTDSPSVNTGVMQKEREIRRTILRGLTQPLSRYNIVFPAHLSQRAKSATADGLTSSDSIDKKVGEI